MQVLKRPIITEKVTALNLQRQYAFDVDVNANKIQIRQAIETQFGVNIISIRTVRIRPKAKLQFTRRGRFSGKTAARKKAYITLKEGQTLDITSGGN